MCYDSHAIGGREDSGIYKYRMGQSSSSHLSREDVEYLQENTSFSKEKIMQYYKAFKKHNPEGRLTKDQFLEMTSSISSSESSKILNEHFFRAADKDGSGEINFKELILVLNMRFTNDPREKLGWVFDLYDIDGNGHIEREEMVKMFKVMVSVASNCDGEDQTSTATSHSGAEEGQALDPEELATSVFNFFNKEQDCSLSREEFIEGGLKDEAFVRVLAGYALK